MKTGEHAALATAQEAFALVVLDVGLPASTVSRSCARLRERRHVPVLIVTGARCRDRVHVWVARRLLPKPFDKSELGQE